jgi:hypothetical protein
MIKLKASHDEAFFLSYFVVKSQEYEYYFV